VDSGYGRRIEALPRRSIRSAPRARARFSRLTHVGLTSTFVGVEADLFTLTVVFTTIDVQPVEEAAVALMMRDPRYEFPFNHS
jgi:hypothetical protein